MYTIDRYTIDMYTIDRYTIDMYTIDRYTIDMYTIDRYTVHLLYSYISTLPLILHSHTKQPSSHYNNCDRNFVALNHAIKKDQ